MRLLEILLIVTNLLVLFLPRSNRRYAAITLLILATLHWVIEGSRWQMSPVYLAVALTALYFLFDWSVARGWVGALGAGATILLLLIGLGLGNLFPIIKLAPLTGNYQVGSMTLHLTDEAREEIYSAETNDKRNLVVNIWYPADVTNEPLAPYMPNPEIGAPAIARDFGLPSFILTHAALVKTRSHVSPPATDGTFPVIFFSHGLGGIRTQNVQMVEELVSQGYIVVAPDHAYAAAYTVFRDGRVAIYDRSIIAWDTPRENAEVKQLVSVWASDFQFLLRQLDQFNADQTHLLFGKMQLEQVGIFGHSTGGGTSFEFCYREPRCAGAIGLDPWVIPVSDVAVAEGLDKPALTLRNPEGLTDPKNTPRIIELHQASAGNRGDWIIEGTKHFDYTDFKQLSRALTWVGMTGEIPAEEIRDLQDESLLAFFEAVFHGGDWERLREISAKYASIQPQD